jgi:hypothetical protein
MNLAPVDQTFRTSPATHISLPVKLLYTAFMAVLVPYYWQAYGPTNFLYYCDVALFLGLVTVWTYNPLPASMAAVGILVPQALWVTDFLSSLAGFPLIGMTAYMFDGAIPLFVRGLSFFHFWLPFFLLYLLHRVGYDRRALVAWTTTAWALMAVAFFLLPASVAQVDNPNTPVNVNYVWGLSDEAPQSWVHPWTWLASMAIGLPIVVYGPTHFALRALFHKNSSVKKLDGDGS